MRQGARNLITDVPGVLVGQAEDLDLRSGVSVVTSDAPFVASVDVMGGGPGTREVALLDPQRTVQAVDAIVLSGGSAFGLDAAGGVMAGLRAAGRGFPVGDVRVPIVPSAIVFDLLNGGARDWAQSPYPALGLAAWEARGAAFSLGAYGAGCGATAGAYQGGVGSASAVLEDGVTVGALAIVNPLGAVCDEAGHFFAAPFELGAEFGGLGPVRAFDAGAEPKGPARPMQNTTLVVVATDMTLDKTGCRRLAEVAQDGLARAIWPCHTALDGDIVFALSTARREAQDPVADSLRLGHGAAACVARAVARAVYLASAHEGGAPSWRDRHG
jgi:L-aminopeptidase/D-esterase-like protein